MGDGLRPVPVGDLTRAGGGSNRFAVRHFLKINQIRVIIKDNLMEFYHV